MKIAGIYLAAGNSRRMGTHKLALPVGTMSLGSLALETALQSALNRIYVIVQERDHLQWLPTDMKEHNKCTIISCSTAAEGQSESLRSGIRRAQEDDMDAAMVLLADQPFVTTQIIDGMIACIRDTPAKSFIATTQDGAISPPVLFSSALYPALLNVSGDTRAREILRELRNEGKLLPCADKRLISDIDTQEEYAALLAAFGY